MLSHSMIKFESSKAAVSHRRSSNYDAMGYIDDSKQNELDVVLFIQIASKETMLRRRQGSELLTSAHYHDAVCGIIITHFSVTSLGMAWECSQG